MDQDPRQFDRREFLKQSACAAVVASVAATTSAAAPIDKKIELAKTIPARMFGKTGMMLPVLGYGGAALPKKWANPLSLEDRVKLVRHAYDGGIRYFDTSISYTYAESQAIIGQALKDVRDNVFFTTKVDFWDRSRPDGRIAKVDKEEVSRQIEKNLAELQTDYIDAVLIHGTPGVEQMTVEQCVEVHAELAKARDKGLVRFVGFSAHGYFDKALALIETGGFDLCMLACGYLPRGHNQRLSEKSIRLREKCLAKAHDLKMGIVAMKVVGAGLLGAWAGYAVPSFDKARLKDLPGSAIRYVLGDKRIHMLAIGMRLPGEIDANIKTLSGDTTYTAADRALLEQFGPRVLSSDAMKKMKLE
ncbi:MAG: General stress protein 69 [Planctomycetes bacterium ADurb.Bin126]|nr:MAG: General stress protein 69 [Planctomycetes bacterium ADurb.Bin126]HOD80701.1 aldo/keto reductase [Phycisphaerae bacterium]HQL74999.1 aldo/keto reductase [Phycisphaerae bacterium]